MMIEHFSSQRPFLHEYAISFSLPPCTDQIAMMCHAALWIAQLFPMWTTWVIVGLLAIWDMVAVLPEKGPLRVLVNTMQVVS